LVILDLLIDEKPTTTVVDEGTSPFGMVNSFGLLELLFTISNYMKKNKSIFSLYISFSKKTFTTHTHTHTHTHLGWKP